MSPLDRPRPDPALGPEIEEALTQAGAFAAWDRGALDDDWLGAYAVGAGPGARLIAHRRVAAGARAGAEAALRGRGVRVGATCSPGPAVWLVDGAGFAAWTDEHTALRADHVGIEVGATTIDRGDVAAVWSFVDPTDVGHRGVALELRDGRRVLVVEEHDRGPHIDPTYGRDELSIDGAWAQYLGRELAGWLAVPHQDELP